jgi:NAD(P) transhydrogenase
MGVQVTLIEPRDAIMPFLDREVREVLVSRMRELSIDTLYQSAPDSVVGNADGTATVRLKDGREVSADIVLWSLGRVGNSDDLALDSVGLAADARGIIKVDGSYRTGVPWVYAAGDVIGFPALASTSLEQGRIAACSMFGKSSRKPSRSASIRSRRSPPSASPRRRPARRESIS